MKASTPRLLNRAAFSLIELLVVIAVIAVLAALLFPAVERARQKGAGIHCMNNLRQLGFAWQSYADDHGGLLVPNWGSAVAGADETCPSWVAGFMDYTSSSHNTNIDYLIHPGVGDRPYGGLLGPYTKEHRLYRCPADKSWVQIGDERLPRVRSISMNLYAGANWMGPLAIEGLNAGYHIYRSLSEYQRLSPSSGWIILDEHEDSINGGGFVVDVIRRAESAQLIDTPASYHNNAGGMNFADGHAETHRWTDPRSIIPVRRLTISTRLQAPFNADIQWLQDRTTAKEDDL
jgi:prepilin-type N-terminal cleavage/methylation domain-containing protein/prepilin-type processing-associated H-X9-DG protein